MAEIKRMFTPEFRNRLDAIISFNALDREIILRVVDKFLMQLEEQLEEKKVEATFTPALREYLAKKGFDPQMGARPMARLIQDTIRSGARRRAAVRPARPRRQGHGGHRTPTRRSRLIFAEEAAPASPDPSRAQHPARSPGRRPGLFVVRLTRLASGRQRYIDNEPFVAADPPRYTQRS